MGEGTETRGLAPTYELALELEAAGLRGVALAERLGVPEESLLSLLAIAHAKAAHAEKGQT